MVDQVNPGMINPQTLFLIGDVPIFRIIFRLSRGVYMYDVIPYMFIKLYQSTMYIY